MQARTRDPPNFLIATGSELKESLPFAVRPRPRPTRRGQSNQVFMRETKDEPAPVDYAGAEINATLGEDEKIRFLAEMLRIRRFEQTALKYYNQGKMGGFLHLYIGQEAVAVGTVSLLGKTTT